MKRKLRDAESAANEYKSALKGWWGYEVDWQGMHPNDGLPESQDLIADLMPLDIGKLYKKIEADDKDRKKYGFSPLMASCSYRQLGALNAESYNERVNSVGKLVLTDGNTLLSDEEIEMLMVLRMNESFMRHMREHYSKYAKQAFNMTIVDDE